MDILAAPLYYHIVPSNIFMQIISAFVLSRKEKIVYSQFTFDVYPLDSP